jgi:hypothetical protein
VLQVYVIAVAVLEVMLLLAAGALALGFVRVAYVHGGFRAQAFTRMCAALRQRDPSLHGTPREKERGERLKRLIDRARHEARAPTDTEDFDRALAVLAGCRDDEQFLALLARAPRVGGAD